MSLSREEVEKVSLLGRLRLTSGELDTMTSQLTAIVDYIEQLKELDTTNVEPMAHAMELRNVFADDTIHPSLPRAARGQRPQERRRVLPRAGGTRRMRLLIGIELFQSAICNPQFFSPSVSLCLCGLFLRA